MEKEPNIFKKPSKKPDPEEHLNEMKRDISLTNSKNKQLTQLNKSEKSTPPTVEEIEEVTEKINKELGL